jgi:hypothetical protein
MRPEIRRLATKPRAFARAAETPYAYMWDCDVDAFYDRGFSDRETSEILSAFRRAHGRPTDTTNVLHNGALTESIGSRRNGCRAR